MILKFWPRWPRKRPLNLSSLRGCPLDFNLNGIFEISGFRWSIFWISRSFDLGHLGVLEKSPVYIFNDYIFEISLFHWSKCTIECNICLTLILKSAQARCARSKVYIFWEGQKFLRNLHLTITVVPVKSKVDILQKFVAFIEYMNFDMVGT